VHRICGGYSDEDYANGITTTQGKECEGRFPEYNKDRVINFNYTNSGFGGDIQEHHDQKGVKLIMKDTDELCSFGYTMPLNNDLETYGKILVPNYTEEISIFVNQHKFSFCYSQSLTNPVYQQCIQITDGIIMNEIRRTIAHEVGHSVHISHRVCETIGDLCNFRYDIDNIALNNPEAIGCDSSGSEAQEECERSYGITICNSISAFDPLIEVGDFIKDASVMNSDTGPDKSIIYNEIDKQQIRLHNNR
jgi:hypothetical protein